ncbi:EAL domain-containing protein [Chungangia koreensis]|uniref:EAL domain-containing protein n=2 Tax=Chungangia koreensis TaxID=752657 RepID=A0ABV8XAR0_9LACT
MFKHFIREQKRSIQNTTKHIALDWMIEKEALDTFFQPIISLSSGMNLGYEILNRPPQDSVFQSTEAFYDFVGQTEMHGRFEQYCIHLSTKRFSQFSQELPNGFDTLLFLNIAPQALVQLENNLKDFEQLLSYHGLLPSQVIFEMTEKQECPDYSVMEKPLITYRKAGFRFAVDDVGSGYNSLKTITVIKPDFIKLDKSLIRYIDQNLDQQNMIRLLVNFSQASGSKLVAEGIERPEEIEYLTAAGIHYGQGYLIGRPAPLLSEGALPICYSMGNQT